MTLNAADFNNPIYLDSATKIYNRAGYAVLMPQLLNEVKTLGQPFTISVLDIDNFKAFNEAYGREAGDKKVAELIEKLRGSIKEINYLFKYGGDELVFVFINRGQEIVAETIIPKVRVVVNGVGLDASIGTVDMQEGDNVETLFDRADNIMHEEKANKKNIKNV